MTSFTDFGLAEPILRALTEEQYVTPTPIQAQTVPLAMEGRDVVGIAQTGTGKTASFALPILHRLIHPRKQVAPKSCRVLVLSPTRELSGQILDSFKAYGRHLKLSAALAIGGVPMGRQVRSVMQGVDVMVATPGRLLDLVRGNALKLSQVEFLVLDEADRMLDMGFINDIRKILAKIPAERQTLFFSATMPKEIASLAEDMLRDPARVAVTPVSSTVERITQRIIHVDGAAKPAILAELLSTETVNRALVFTRTKHGADKVVKGLERNGIAADAIHGNKSQNHRERVLAAFRTGTIRTLVATDIAARGIDVDGISHVINYDLPNIPESYVHRIGRTARAGADGTAISLVANGDEIAYLRDIEKLIRVSLPREDRRSADQRIAERPAQGQRGQRPGQNQGDAGSKNRRNRRPAYKPQDHLNAGQHDAARQEARPNRDVRQNNEPRQDRRQDANRHETGRHGAGSQDPRRQESRGQEPRRQEARHQESHHQEARQHEPRRNENGALGGRHHAGRPDSRPENNRHQAPRPSHGGREGGMQSVAFLRRDTRPGKPPARQNEGGHNGPHNRNRKPQPQR